MYFHIYDDRQKEGNRDIFIKVLKKQDRSDITKIAGMSCLMKSTHSKKVFWAREKDVLKISLKQVSPNFEIVNKWIGSWLL